MSIHSPIDSEFWTGKKVLLTGGSGFLGKPLAKRLEAAGAKVSVPRQKDFDLRDRRAATLCVRAAEPDVVIHAAAYYGGLGITMSEPGKIFYDNLIMGAHLMEEARLQGVGKFVTIGTNCAYPGFLSGELTEDQFWAGSLHPSVMSYGTAKKMLHAQGVSYRQQYGFDAIYLIPSNLYGPGDHFEDHRSHVTAALVKKFVQGIHENTPVSIWGSGSAIRDFLYIEDAAEGIILAAQKYNDSSPLNIGTGQGTSILELASTIAEKIGYHLPVHWDKSKPDGQPIKILSTDKMKRVLHWSPQTSLAEGVEKTLAWYLGQLPLFDVSALNLPEVAKAA